MKDLLEKITNYCSDKEGTDFCEVRASKLLSNVVQVNNNIVGIIEPSASSAASVRILHNGSWGFATTNELNAKTLQTIADKALKLAKMNMEMSEEKVKIKPSPAIISKGITDSSSIVDPREGSLEELQEIIVEASKAAMNIDNRISRLAIQCTNDLNLQYYTNNEGSWIESFVPSTFLNISAVAKEGAKSKFARNRFAVSSSYDVLTYADPIGLAKKIASEAIELLSTKEHPRGKMPIILNNFLSGTISTTIGNFLKAQNTFGDIALTNPFANKMNEKIASELLTVTNEPNLEGMPVFYEYDVEGIQATKTSLIEKGILKGYIADRASATKMGNTPTGCTRAISAAFQPVAEMSNVIIKTGDFTLPELLEDISEGIYATNLAGASTIGSKSLITSESGFIIKNGELTEQTDQISFSLDISQDLLKIDAIGDDFAPFFLHHYSGAYYAIIGTGTPHVRFSSLEVK